MKIHSQTKRSKRLYTIIYNTYTLIHIICIKFNEKKKRTYFFVRIHNEDENCGFHRVDFNKIASLRHFMSVFALCRQTNWIWCFIQNANSFPIFAHISCENTTSQSQYRYLRIFFAFLAHICLFDMSLLQFRHIVKSIVCRCMIIAYFLNFFFYF